MPTGVAVADFNGDGKPDLVVVNFFSSVQNDVFISLGKGDGTFQTAVPLGTGGFQTAGVAVGDFNGDGKPDLAVMTTDFAMGNGHVAVFLNTSSGGALSFGSPTLLGVDKNPSAIAIGDIDGDGKQDIAVFSGTTGNANILLGKGDGTFQPSASFIAMMNLATGVVGFALADINGDGKPDLVILQSEGPGLTNTDQLQVSINASTTGTVSFTGPTVFSLAAATTLGFTDLAVADFNGDGKPDLAMATSGAGLFVLLDTTSTGSSTPTFGTLTSFNAFTEQAIGIADVNGDGLPDIVGVQSFSTSGATLLNTTPAGTPATGAPTFTSGATFNVAVGNANTPSFLNIADFNEDGQLDVAVVYRTASSQSATLNDNGSTVLGLGGNTNTLAVAPGTVPPNTAVMLTATIAPGQGLPATTPTGNVQFVDSVSGNLGSAVTLAPGAVPSATASLSTSALALGVHSLTASYTGDANFCPTTSKPQTETVQNSPPPAPDFTLAANPSSLTVTSGQTAMTTITLTAQNGFNSMVTFSCSGLPLYSSCNFNPPSLTGSGTSTMTFTAHSMLLPPSGLPFSKTPPYFYLYATLATAALLAFLWLASTKRNKNATARWILQVCFQVLFLLLAVHMMQGCGGGYGGGGSKGGGGGGGGLNTPQGTSQITVTASATGLSHNLNISVTVQ